MPSHLISITDLTPEAVEKIFHLTRDVKRVPEAYQTALQGKMFGLIFEKPSTRTWVSFEAGLFSLGSGSIYLGPENMKLGVREEVRDVARVLSRYLAGVILRTFTHRTILEFGKFFQRPIINGLSDLEHPCQALADYFTIYEKFAAVNSPKLAFIGDGNNVLHSLLYVAALVGGTLHYATPRNREPSAAVVKRALAIAKKTGATIKGWHDPVKAVAKADIVYTDVWVSMGEEKQRDKKMLDFKGMQINKKLLKHAQRNALVMHCLPAHRGEEITDDVMESSRSVIFDQAENRLHVQKAVLLHLCHAH
ncbi:MAG: ornithine carbamoyltransferase [Omnitrophica bacterium GWA2_52_8]|nr:MAG: ornithine carbamoyltransferase [Omnitrophica bacterium GWA2_52_8]